MNKIKLHLSKMTDNSYEIIIGKELFPLIVNWAVKNCSGKISIITDSNVEKLYGNKLLSMLKNKKLPAKLFSFRAGEASKTGKVKEILEDKLASNKFGRDSLVIALGGGVVGDLAGFVASTYMRGIPFIQVPTTLLAMVDSSIGGKTGVNTSFGKNLIGAFYQPAAVFIDVETLESLDRKEMLNGIVEMIKHGIIADRNFFLYMRDNIERIYNLEESVLTRAIKRSCEIKKTVVEADEKESYLRKMLNFGHTIGHSIEKASGFRISHGAAVGTGIIAETKIAEKLKMIDSMESKKITGLIAELGITTDFLKTHAREIVKNTLLDKKNTAKKINYVLPVKIGKVAIDVTVKKSVVFSVLSFQYPS